MNTSWSVGWASTVYLFLKTSEHHAPSPSLFLVLSERMRMLCTVNSDISNNYSHIDSCMINRCNCEHHVDQWANITRYLDCQSPWSSGRPIIHYIHIQIIGGNCFTFNWPCKHYLSRCKVTLKNRWKTYRVVRIWTKVKTFTFKKRE